MPKLQLYHWAFTLGTLISWFNYRIETSWRALENNMVLPLKLNEILFSNIPIRKSQVHFGPIVSHLLVVLTLSERKCGIGPLIHPAIIMIVCWLVNPKLSLINVASGTTTGFNGDRGLYSFEEPTFHFFYFYLQLRIAMKTYGIPRQGPLEEHSLIKVVCQARESRKTASKLYRYFLENSYVSLPVDASWREDDLTWPEPWLQLGWCLGYSHPEIPTTNRST